MPFSVIVQERLQSNICVKVDRALDRLFPGTKVSFSYILLTAKSGCSYRSLAHVPASSHAYHVQRHMNCGTDNPPYFCGPYNNVNS